MGNILKDNTGFTGGYYYILFFLTYDNKAFCLVVTRTWIFFLNV